MIRLGFKAHRLLFSSFVLTALAFGQLASDSDSNAAIERTYPYSLEAVQQALQRIGGFGGGKLPILDGFVVATQDQLERYEHPYYQYRVHLKPAGANNTLVSVEARISALYANSDPARDEYHSLTSNGRLETDLHDRLLEALRSVTATPVSKQPKVADSAVSVAKPAAAELKTPSALAVTQEQLNAVIAERQSVQQKTAALQAQIEHLKAADHKPANATKVASVKRSGVGVMSRQNFGGPVLFRAQAEDEFEVIQLESGWAQVRLGSDSTGYIQSEELNLPSGIVEKTAPDAATAAQKAAATRAPDLGFSVSREDVTVFSGDWARLKGRKVLFVYAQPRGLLSDLGSEDAKLGYAKRIFESRYRAVAQSKTDVEGVVVVFLGGRGGVAAATLSDIRQWVEGGLADEAFVNRCSLDPVTEFRSMRLN
jgi:hypothetical protein